MQDIILRLAEMPGSIHDRQKMGWFCASCTKTGRKLLNDTTTCNFPLVSAYRGYEHRPHSKTTDNGWSGIRAARQKERRSGSSGVLSDRLTITIKNLQQLPAGGHSSEKATQITSGAILAAARCACGKPSQLPYLRLQARRQR